MLYITENTGHMFFGFIVFVLAMAALADSVAVKTPKRLFLDVIWGPIMLVMSIIYLGGLLLSLPVDQARNFGGPQGQHILLALLLIVTSSVGVFWWRKKYALEIARIAQVAGGALIMLVHTHHHAGGAWIKPYHRLLFILLLTLAGVFMVRLVTQAKGALHAITATLFVFAVALLMYDVPPSPPPSHRNQVCAAGSIMRPDDTMHMDDQMSMMHDAPTCNT